jgi:hypothetical protein
MGNPSKSFVVLFGALILCGCAGRKPDRAPVSPAPGAQIVSEKKAADDPTYRNALALLDDLLNDEKRLKLILLIKRETPELKQMVKDISESAAEGAKILKELATADPSLDLKRTQLPPGEEATRKAIAKTKEGRLLKAKGEEFEFQILLSQAEALTYASHLSGVAAANDPDRMRARKLLKLSFELDQLANRVLAMMKGR